MLPSVHFPCNFIVLFLLSSLTFFFSLIYSALSLLFHIFLSPPSLYSSFLLFLFFFLFLFSLSRSLSPSVPLTHFCYNALMLRNNDNTYHCCAISTRCHSVPGCYATNLDTDAFTCNHFKSLKNKLSLLDKGLWPKYRYQQFLSTVLHLPLYFCI